MTQPPIEDRRFAGIGLILIALLFFTGIDTCAKWLVLSGMPTLVVTCVRYAGHMLIAAAVIIPRKGTGLLRTNHLGAEILRALFLLAGTLLNFTAVKYLSLTLTSAIMFTIPLWVCLLSIPILGEHVGVRRWLAILFGFSGILIVTRPWSAEAHWAVLLSLATAVCTSLYIIMTRKLAGRDSTGTLQLYAAGVATLAITPFALTDWQWPVTTIGWWLFALIGVFGWAGHQALTIAHRFAPATTLAPFVYVQIIYMTASSWLFFDQPPDGWVLAGAGVVLASGLYIWLREKQLGGVG